MRTIYSLHKRLSVLLICGFVLISFLFSGFRPFSIPVALDGFVGLQGRQAAPNPAWSVNLTLTFYPAGSTTSAAQINVQTTNNGTFSISDTELTPGPYVITVKNEHTLTVAYAADLVEGSNSIDFGNLPEGDADNNDVVTILDFSILSTSFGLSTGNPGYDDRADFNEDGSITIQDFSLLSTNFGAAGYVVTASSYNDLVSPGGRVANEASTIPFYGQYVKGPIADIAFNEVDMELIAARQNDRIEVKVRLNAINQSMDAAAATLTYNPQAIRLITKNSTHRFPVTLTEASEDGLVEFAAGTLDDLPDGATDFMTLSFEIIDPDKSHEIRLVPEKAAITFAGRNILGEVLNQDIPGFSRLKVYPNPGDGIFHLEPAGRQILGFQVIDIRGKVILDDAGVHGVGNRIIDLSNAPTGVYTVRVVTENGSSVERIVKE